MKIIQTSAFASEINRNMYGEETVSQEKNYLVYNIEP